MASPVLRCRTVGGCARAASHASENFAHCSAGATKPASTNTSSSPDSSTYPLIITSFRRRRSALGKWQTSAQIDAAAADHGRASAGVVTTHPPRPDTTRVRQVLHADLNLKESTFAPLHPRSARVPFGDLSPAPFSRWEKRDEPGIPAPSKSPDLRSAGLGYVRTRSREEDVFSDPHGEKRRPKGRASRTMAARSGLAAILRDALAVARAPQG